MFYETVGGMIVCSWCCWRLRWRIGCWHFFFFSDEKYFTRPFLPKFSRAFWSFLNQIFRFFHGFFFLMKKFLNFLAFFEFWRENFWFFFSTFFLIWNLLNGLGPMGPSTCFLGPTGPCGPRTFMLANRFLKTCLVPRNSTSDYHKG